MDRSFEIRPVPDAQVRSGPVRSSVRDRSGSRDRQNIEKKSDAKISDANFFAKKLFDENLLDEKFSGARSAWLMIREHHKKKRGKKAWIVFDDDDGSSSMTTMDLRR